MDRMRDAMLPDTPVRPCPMSHNQVRLWFLDRLGMRGAVYQHLLSMMLEGELDVTALRDSFTTLVQRHESLRTHFEELDGEGVQVIDPPYEFPLLIQDLSALPPPQQQD